MKDCIFCKIASGEIPSKLVYEDEYVIAFEDLNPQAPIHTLVVPREHHVTIGDDISTELMGHIFAAVPKVAAVKGVSESGYRTIINSGDNACQTVHHMHIHIIGGCKMSEGMVRTDDK